jgi:hypothetical protein
MNQHEFEELNGVDFAEDLLKTIENEYGRTIMKIPKFSRIAYNKFLISIIFSDYRLLEGEIEVIELYGMPAIKLEGTYY